MDFLHIQVVNEDIYIQYKLIKLLRVQAVDGERLIHVFLATPRYIYLNYMEQERCEQRRQRDTPRC